MIANAAIIILFFFPFVFFLFLRLNRGEINNVRNFLNDVEKINSINDSRVLSEEEENIIKTQKLQEEQHLKVL
jgi:hypothetical protein